jgi:Crassvirales DNA primase
MDYFLFTETDILERVDEYTLYCHYLGYDVTIGAKYPCPDAIRISNGKQIDLNPSFGVFERRYGGNLPHEFLWKDSAVGHTGDIFALVQRLYNLSTKTEAIQRIAAEFGFGGTFNYSSNFNDDIAINKEKRYLEPIDISIKSRPFNTRDLLYWDRYNIDRDILDQYFVKPFSAYWLTANQKIPSFVKGLGYAYWILQKYQLYMPYAPKKDKFRNDWTDLCVPGFAQLTYKSDTCIITKSMKDVMCLRSFAYDSVSSRSESIMLPPECIAHLKRRYKRILVLFDNDMKHNGHKYEFDKIYVPKEFEVGDKDVSDYCDNHGVDETTLMLKSIIYGY